MRRLLAEALDRQAPGRIRIVSLCAGQGRDVVPVVAVHPRGCDVAARLVELDPRNAEVAASAARDAGLEGVEVVVGDAALTASCAGAVPADVVLACGIFGNVAAEDIEHTIEQLPMLCAPEATVLWTRGRTAPDLTPTIRRWFGESDFEELAFEGDPSSYGVGAHRLRAPPAPFDPGVRLFTFVEDAVT